MGDFPIAVLKFTLAILLIPVIFASTINFYDHLEYYPINFKHNFLAGVGTFFLIFLFFYQMWGVYEFGQKLVNGVAKLAVVFDQFITDILPFYVLVLMGGYCIATRFFNLTGYEQVFVFFSGFFFTMHIILTAQDIMGREDSAIKPSYYLSMSIVIIVNVCLAVLCLDLFAGKLSFSTFFFDVYKNAKDIYLTLLKIR